MLVSPQLLRTVVFLSQLNDHGEQVPKGTAFLVVHPLTEESGFPYLVTARHVIEAARATGHPLFLRGNDNDGNLEIRDLPDFDAWHVSSATDVAVLDLPPIPGLDVVGISPQQFATAAFLQEHSAGLGDEVFFLGLFTAHPGSQHNEPIVRFGNVSMLPNEPVAVRNADGSFTPTSAFLVEARSWGGQSGSPAFIWLSPIREPGVMRIPRWAGDPGEGGVVEDIELPHLLGLVCGHFELPQDVAFTLETLRGAQVKQNTGVAIVIPADDILRELQDEELVARRDELLRRVKDSRTG
ncbi:MAG: hypothetical protein QOH21_806 [Acidobacteriota bacterium]|jgi:hypothetical protein|nr:hypothetical protein [Acidobacteriota bacterium]